MNDNGKTPTPAELALSKWNHLIVDTLKEHMITHINHNVTVLPSKLVLTRCRDAAHAVLRLETRRYQLLAREIETHIESAQKLFDHIKKRKPPVWLLFWKRYRADLEYNDCRAQLAALRMVLELVRNFSPPQTPSK
jgi:hypothetical protein